MFAAVECWCVCLCLCLCLKWQPLWGEEFVQAACGWFLLRGGGVGFTLGCWLQVCGSNIHTGGGCHELHCGSFPRFSPKSHHIWGFSLATAFPFASGAVPQSSKYLKQADPPDVQSADEASDGSDCGHGGKAERRNRPGV